MNRSSKIVFFGNERLSSGFNPQGAPTLQKLIDAGYSIVAIVANHHEGTSRSQRKLEIQEIAEQNNIPLFLPAKPMDICNELLALKPDIGVLVAYGRIVPQEIIDIFPAGIVNIHPSLLPLYRGSTPIEQAVLDGTKQTGVSLMLLVKEMDAGPIFAQKEVDLKGNESKAYLTQKLLELGGEMLVKTLPGILRHTVEPTPQDDSKATYSKLFSKSDGQLDVTLPATQLEHQVRAYLDWPKSRMTILDQSVIITKTRVTGGMADGKCVIACGNNTFLEIQELIAPSGRKMSGADFIRGYKK